MLFVFFFFSSRRRHTSCSRDWSSDVCSSDLERVSMRATDTSVTPFDRSTGASRSTTVMGSAVKAATEDLRRQLIDAAAEVLNTSTNTITMANGEVRSGG